MTAPEQSPASAPTPTGSERLHIASVFTRLGLLPTPDEHRRVRVVVTYLNGAG